jgi:hypothetical protein
MNNLTADWCRTPQSPGSTEARDRDEGAHPSLVDTIRINRLLRPFRWFRLANWGLLYLAVTAPGGMVALILQSRFDYQTIIGSSILLLWLAFPGWIAWKNNNVVNCVNQRYTITSLLLVGLPAVVWAAVLLPHASRAFKNIDTEESFQFFNFFTFLSAGASVTLVAALAVWRLRHRVIAPLEVKLAAMLLALSPGRTNRRRINIRPRRPLLGWTLIVTAVMITIGKGFIPLSRNTARFGNYIVQFAFFLVLMARSAFQPSATVVLKADTRKPVFTPAVVHGR